MSCVGFFSSLDTTQCICFRHDTLTNHHLRFLLEFIFLQEVDPSTSAVKPKGPISLNAFTETVAGGRVDHDDEGDITSSDEDD